MYADNDLAVEAIYEQVSLGQGTAPLTFVKDLKNVRHSEECGSKEGGIICSESSPAHTSRSLCACMTPFEIDREFVAELLSRELVADAFYATLSAARQHGVSSIIKDDLFLQAIRRYDHLTSTYKTLRSCPRPMSTSKPFFHAELIPSSYDDVPRVKSCIGTREAWIEFCQAYSALPINHYLGVFDDLGAPWVSSLEDENTFVAYRFSPSHPRKCTIRADATIDSSMVALLAVMSEVPMTQTWCPYFRFPMHVGLREAREVKKLGRLEKASLYKVDLPWPISNREVYLHGWLVDDLDHNGNLVMSFRGIDPDYPVHGFSAVGSRTPDEKAIFIFVEGACCIRKGKGRKVEVSLIWNIDLKMNIPRPLLGFVTKTFVKLGLQSLADVCVLAETDPVWIALATKNPWLYQYMDQRITSWLREQGDFVGAAENEAFSSARRSYRQQASGTTASESGTKKRSLLFWKSRSPR